MKPLGRVAGFINVVSDGILSACIPLLEVLPDDRGQGIGTGLVKRMLDQEARVEPVYFPSPAAFHAWLEAHHASADELWVGYHKRGTGTPSLTWPESVDEALSFGWIDGLRRRVDDERYAIRFTPRRKGSAWSRVNLGRVEALITEGRMRPTGLAAYEGRKPDAAAGYTYEERPQELPEAYARTFRERDAAAWAFFEVQSPSYRRTAIGWILAAKREETRLRRLAEVVEASAAGRRWIQGAPRGMTR